MTNLEYFKAFICNTEEKNHALEENCSDSEDSISEERNYTEPEVNSGLEEIIRVNDGKGSEKKVGEHLPNFLTNSSSDDLTSDVIRCQMHYFAPKCQTLFRVKIFLLSLIKRSFFLVQNRCKIG